MLHKFRIRENYRDNDFLRNQFFGFIGRAFPRADFREWYQRGFWSEDYIPFSIVRGDQIVSNVCAAGMSLVIDGRPIKGIQIGAVATAPEYRRQGLSRVLMEHVLHKYRASVELVFLFANDSVLEFYPRFGFEKHEEVIFISDSIPPAATFCARRLDMGLEADFALVKQKLLDRQALTEIFGAKDYDFITFWHILNIYSGDLLYLEKDDVIFIARQEGKALHIFDIIYSAPFDLWQAISKIVNNNDIKSILYYFPPDLLDFRYDSVQACDDSPLFVKGSFDPGDKYFKFPVTAQT